MSDESLKRHTDLWRDLPLMAGVPIPADHDGENRELRDLADSIFGLIELIGAFDKGFALAFVQAELARDGDVEIERILSDPWSWRGAA